MRAVNTQTIRKFSGAILGYLDMDKDGNQQVRDFYGRILGYYDKNSDTTRDFYGKIVTRGNTVLGFLYQDLDK